MDPKFEIKPQTKFSKVEDKKDPIFVMDQN